MEQMRKRQAEGRQKAHLKQRGSSSSRAHMDADGGCEQEEATQPPSLSRHGLHAPHPTHSQQQQRQHQHHTQQQGAAMQPPLSKFHACNTQHSLNQSQPSHVPEKPSKPVSSHGTHAHKPTHSRHGGEDEEEGSETKSIPAAAVKGKRKHSFI